MKISIDFARRINPQRMRVAAIVRENIRCCRRSLLDKSLWPRIARVGRAYHHPSRRVNKSGERIGPFLRKLADRTENAFTHNKSHLIEIFDRWRAVAGHITSVVDRGCHPAHESRQDADLLDHVAGLRADRRGQESQEGQCSRGGQRTQTARTPRW